MTDSELNIRFNTVMIVDLLSIMLSWMTPYPWWQDVLIVCAVGVSIMVPLLWKAR